MLTKEERAAIAERAKECIEVDGSLYEVLFGYPSYRNRPYEEGFKEILTRIIELCDTSNMVELPLDKDGEVIRIGDVVYDEQGIEWQASSFNLFGDNSTVTVRSDTGTTAYQPRKLTHKRSSTIKLLAGKIRDVVSNSDDMSFFAAQKILHLLDKLEKLGDSDD